MTWNGFKKTFTAVAPTFVLAGLDMIQKSPSFLTKSGIGGMLYVFLSLYGKSIYVHERSMPFLRVPFFFAELPIAYPGDFFK